MQHRRPEWFWRLPPIDRKLIAAAVTAAIAWCIIDSGLYGWTMQHVFTPLLMHFVHHIADAVRTTATKTGK